MYIQGIFTKKEGNNPFDEALFVVEHKNDEKKINYKAKVDESEKKVEEQMKLLS